MRVEVRLPVDCGFAVSDSCCDIVRWCDCDMLEVCVMEKYRRGKGLCLFASEVLRATHQARKADGLETATC
jgi:hypothetical protein